MARKPAPLADLVSLIRWVKLLRSVKPDVISVGTPKAGLLGSLAGVIARVPNRIYQLRGLRLETAAGPMRWILTAMEMLTMKSAHHVLAVSPSLRQRAVELRLVDSQKISVLGVGSSNGVDIGRVSDARASAEDIALLRQQHGLIDSVPVIGFVGRLTRDKGIDVLAEAREILAREGLDHQLLVVGGIEDEGGNANLSPDTCRAAAVTGHVSNPEAYYPLMDVLCLPTLREGFPNVVLEAAIAGVPTVTTTATGAIDSVVDGQTGLLAEVGSAESLARMLTSALADETFRETLGQQAAEWVRQHFDREIVWARLRDYFAELQGRTARV